MNTKNTFNDIRTIAKEQYPALLRTLEKLPDRMDIIGSLPPDSYRYLCVVGTRKPDQYGKDACEYLIKGLAGYPIVIVSGLAFGIDSIAHEAALAAGLKTIAFPGSGLSREALSPQSHIGLAERIISAGGALVSPFKRYQRGDTWTYPVRNVLMAGISHATLVIEGGEGSGTEITAKETAEFSRLMLIVPGSIYSPLSYVPHKYLRDGATAITKPEDILEVLGWSDGEETTQSLFNVISDEENKILDIIGGSIQKDELIYSLDMPVGYINSILVEMELKGMIKDEDGVIVRRKI